MIEKIEMRGRLSLIMTDRQGRQISRQAYDNHIVSSGRSLVAEMFSGQFGGPPPTAVSHMAVGTGSTAASDGDTALESQRGDRNAITSATLATFDDSGVQRVRVSLQTVFDFDQVNDATIPLREAGIFTALTGGVMYNRVVFEPVTKTNAFKLTLLWDVIF